MTTPSDHPLTTAIRTGDVDGLRQLLRDHPDLATARVDGRSTLHIATDWPGHFPNVANTIAALVAAGAEVNARFQGSHSETPLDAAQRSEATELVHWLREQGAKSAAQQPQADP